MTGRLSAEDRQKLFRSCARPLSGHGRRNVKSELLALAGASEAELPPDVYGEGGVLEALEAEVAALLGKPAAVFMPSGTMAQQIALRIHAGRTARDTIAFHPTCHLELHEHKAYSHLHRLHARLVGRRDRLLTLSDLELVAEPLAALLIELPQREIGGVLPAWAELVAEAEWARQRGVALHLDGARVWECAPFYGKSVAEIASLFDSVYVSFYKTLGAIAGAALLGSADFVREAKVWQRRHGGNLVSMFPLALSARQSLKGRLAQIEWYCDDARRVAARLARLPGVRIHPDPPHTNMFHAFFPVDPERLLDASAELARARGVALFTRARVCDVPGHCSVELSMGDAARAISDLELDSWLEELWEKWLAPERVAHEPALEGGPLGGSLSGMKPGS